MSLFTAGLLATACWQAYDYRTVRVVFYNDTNRTIQDLVLTVGVQRHDAGVLEAGESLMLRFKREAKVQDLQIYFEGEPPFSWQAPGLVRGESGCLTLHVYGQDSVTVSADPGLLRRLWTFFD